MTFNEKGAGVCVQVTSVGTSTYTFNYAYIESAQLSLTGWSDNAFGYSTDANDYDNETPENATMFILNGKPTLNVYRTFGYDYHKFTRVD